MSKYIVFEANTDAVGGLTAVSAGTAPNEAGDLLVLHLAVANSASVAFTTPPGWTLIETQNNDDNHTALYWRMATMANEIFPAVVLSSSCRSVAHGVVVRGVTASPIGNISRTTSGTPRYVDGASITTSVDNSTVLHFLSRERRQVPRRVYRSEPNQIWQNSESTMGATPGIDIHSAFVSDYAFNLGTTLGGPQYDCIQTGGATITHALEILSNNSIIPLSFGEFVLKDIKPDEYTLGGSDAWRDAVSNSGALFEDGSTPNLYSFDAVSDVDLSTDQITIIAHGIANGRVVRADANGNTLPAGITDGAYYYVSVEDVNTITLRSAEDEINNNTGWFENNGTPKATVNITALGLGTCRFQDVGLEWVLVRDNDGGLQRPPFDTISTLVQYYGGGITFDTPRDLSKNSIAF
ncbi:MAG: hypothetical protein AAFQ07_15195, partial [Chloroflexota bacterium]